MEPQAVPMAPVRKADMRRMRVARRFSEGRGEARKVL